MSEILPHDGLAFTVDMPRLDDSMMVTSMAQLVFGTWMILYSVVS